MTAAAGPRWELAGATQMTNDVFRTLGIAMLIAILLVYIIMVATFRSLLNPLILLVSIPFAAVGAVLALVITGTSLGMPSLIGLLMLIGIVVTNAIVLLDLVEQFRRQGMDAAHGRHRRRAAPAAADPHDGRGHDPRPDPDGARHRRKGGFLSTPLAVVVIGGLFTSTVLTLILVPVLYLAFDRLRPKGAYEPDEEDAPRRPRSRRRRADGRHGGAAQVAPPLPCVTARRRPLAAHGAAGRTDDINERRARGQASPEEDRERRQGQAREDAHRGRPRAPHAARGEARGAHRPSSTTTSPRSTRR